MATVEKIVEVNGTNFPEKHDHALISRSLNLIIFANTRGTWGSKLES